MMKSVLLFAIVCVAVCFADEDRVKYLDYFEDYSGKNLLIPSLKVLRGVRDAEDCARQCLLSYGFKCQGFDLVRVSNNCVLHSKSILQLERSEYANILGKDSIHYALQNLEFFDAYPGISVKSPNGAVLRVAKSAEDCARLCHLTDRFNCQGFDYCQISSTCLLHSAHILDLEEGEVVYRNQTKCIHYAKKDKNGDSPFASTSTQSECEERRERALKHGTIMKLIPKCKENGDYEELQCYEDSKFCVCYDKKGHPAIPILSSLKECGCFLERKRKIDSNHENAFIPQCESTGAYTKKQCWDYNNSCWCVDENGKQKGDIKSDGDQLDCV